MLVTYNKLYISINTIAAKYLGDLNKYCNFQKLLLENIKKIMCDFYIEAEITFTAYQNFIPTFET